MICKEPTEARRRYLRATLQFMAGCLVVVLCWSWFVKHDGRKKFFLYFWSVLPAISVLALIVRMDRYWAAEEKDEYQRLLAMQSILAGTAALLGTIVVSDFLRSFAKTGNLPPFTGFLIFCGGMAGTEFVQRVRNRVPKDG